MYDFNLVRKTIFLNILYIRSLMEPCTQSLVYLRSVNNEKEISLREATGFSIASLGVKPGRSVEMCSLKCRTVYFAKTNKHYLKNKTL